MEEFYKAISGMGAALEKQQKTIQRNLRETALLAEVVAQKQQAIALGETFAGSTVEGDALREQQWRQSGRGIGFDRMQAQAALLAEFSEAERAIIDQINELEGNPSAWDDRLAELQESLDGRMADLDAYFDGLERLADVERELVSSARERAELTAAAAHDMHLLSLEGATAAEVDERRLQHYADLMASLEAHHAELVRIGATAEQIAEAEREMAAATVQSTRALEVRLAELQRTQGDLDGDPGAVAATFRTAVGTVSLPSAAETANLQREHIREQQATRLAIEAVEQAILQIASTHP
jgi:hypothetical protein